MPCMHKSRPCVHKNRPFVHKNRPCLCENNLYRRETGLTGKTRSACAKQPLQTQSSHCRRKAAIADEEIILPGAEEGPD